MTDACLFVCCYFGISARIKSTFPEKFNVVSKTSSYSIAIFLNNASYISIYLLCLLYFYYVWCINEIAISLYLY